MAPRGLELAVSPSGPECGDFLQSGVLLLLVPNLHESRISRRFWKSCFGDAPPSGRIWNFPMAKPEGYRAIASLILTVRVLPGVNVRTEWGICLAPFCIFVRLETRPPVERTAAKLIENYRKEYNTIRPHSSLGYRAPAPQALAWKPVLAAAVGGGLD